MHAAGIITEYNPLHVGHVRLLREARALLGPDTLLVCVMSGDFVQRGAFAVVRRQARAEAAVLSGADLVLELPLPWAVSSAEGFAEGAVAILNAVGCLDALVFGSESGDAGAILRTAELLLSPDFPPLLRQELARGDSFPAARQRAAVRLAVQRNREPSVSGTADPYPENTEQQTPAEPYTESSEPESGFAADIAAVLARPNDTLAVEYCKALLRSGSVMRPVAVRREGAGHDSSTLKPGESPSGSALRSLLRQGETETALCRMAPAMADAFRREMAAGRAPVFDETAERAVLCRLRSLSRQDFAALDGGREGVGYRLYKAVQQAATVREILETAKTRRYPLSRLRRMVLWAYLGLSPLPADTHAEPRPAGGLSRPAEPRPFGVCPLWPSAPPYLRPLAASTAGTALLARMRSAAALPILTRPKDVNKHAPAARALFQLEARAADLYALAYPDLAAARGGALWREGMPPPLSRA